MLQKIANPENLYKAFCRVEASHGGPGVDGITVAEFKRRLTAGLETVRRELLERAYAPLPLLRFTVAKRDGSPRVLMVPAVRDRIAQAAVLNIVEPMFEACFEDVSFAYRKGRSLRQAALRIRDLREQGYHYVVDADIDAFFDNIDQELLLAKTAEVIADTAVIGLVRNWVRAEVYDGEKIYVLQKGLPQGTVISPMLANLFLDELDESLLAQGYQLVRYSDDFIVLAKRRSDAEQALHLTEEILADLHLALDEEDTCITDFRKGFKYLGLVFIGDTILAPFDRPKKQRRILYMPPPFDLPGYLAAKCDWR